MNKHFLEELVLWSFVKSLVERENRTRALETVSCKVQLVHGVHVLDVELGGGSVWRLGEPHVEIEMLAGFKVHDVVAVVEFSDLVELLQL